MSTKEEIKETSVATEVSNTTVNETSNADETVNNQNVENDTKKRKRRGINNDTRGTARKKFHERALIPNTGLFLGHLEDVSVSWSTLKEDAKLPSFAGLAVPRINFVFATNESDSNSRMYYNHSFLPIESTVETIPGGKKEWMVNNIFDFMKHILNVFVLKGKSMTVEQEDLLALEFTDFDDDMQFVALEPEEIINGYKILFENFVALINNNGKPYYKDAKGSFIPIWMKLLRFTKSKGNWNAVVGSPNSSNFGDFGFSSFIGSGIIELYKGASVAPTLTINVANESLTFKEEAAKAKTPNVGIPGQPVMPVMNNFTPNGDTFASSNPVIPSTAGLTDDLPF